MADNFPNKRKKTDIKIKEAQRVPNQMNPNRTKPRHTVMKKAKVKDNERILKEAKEKQMSHM